MSRPSLSQEEIKLNREATIKAVEAYGTARLFERRAAWYRKMNKIRDVLGIGVPAMVGFIFMTFSFAPDYISGILVVSGLIAAAQLVLSVLSIVYGWDGGYSYARESVADNNRIRNDLEIILNSNETIERRRERMEELRRDIQSREKEDEAQGLGDDEKCYGRRQGHAQYQQQCVICKKVPRIGKIKHKLCVQYQQVS